MKAFATASYFDSVTNNRWMRYSLIESLEGLGHVNRALDSLKILIENEPDVEAFKNKRVELEEKLKK